MTQLTLKNSVLFLVALLSAASCGPSGPQNTPPSAIPVTVQTVQATNAVYYDEYPATVSALNQVDLRPQINGYINGIHFKEGQHVKKGERLYSIDPQQYEGAYQQAAANLAAQEANLVRAKKDVDRYHALEQQNAVARQLVDNAEAAYEVARKQVEAARAGVESVQTNVRYTTIAAPFDGTIGLSMVKMGAAVSAGQTVLNTISSDNPIGVDISIDQKEIFRFTRIKDNPKPGDSTFRLAFGRDVYPYPGHIRFMDRAVNAQTGTMLVRIEFENPQNLVRAGMTGTLRVLNNSAEKSIVIPYKAVTEQLGEYFVYVVRTDSSKVSQHRVQLGKQIDRNIVVREGLHEGETIVTEGVQNLREGATVATGATKGVAEAKK